MAVIANTPVKEHRDAPGVSLGQSKVAPVTLARKTAVAIVVNTGYSQPSACIVRSQANVRSIRLSQAVIAFRVIRGLLRGAAYGLVHGAIASVIVAILWAIRRQLYTASDVAFGLLGAALSGFGSLLSWFSPYVLATVSLIFHLIIWLAQAGWHLAHAVLQTFLALGSSLVALIVTTAKLILFLILAQPQPASRTDKIDVPRVAGQTKPPAATTAAAPDDNSVEVFEARVAPTEGSSESRLKFLRFSSDCSWRGASSSDIACSSGSVTFQFDDVMRRATAVVADAPRILIIGAASCEGSDRGKNERLAEDRARHLYQRALSAGLKDKRFILVTLGQFQSYDCDRLADDQRAKQRPIVIAGLYGRVDDGDLLKIVSLALRQHAALPQVSSYSKPKLIPIAQ